MADACIAVSRIRAGPFAALAGLLGEQVARRKWVCAARTSLIQGHLAGIGFTSDEMA